MISCDLQAWENPVFVTVNIKEDLMCGAAGIVVFEDEHCSLSTYLPTDWSTNQLKAENVLVPSQKSFLLLPLLELCECGQVTVDGKQRRPRRVT